MFILTILYTHQPRHNISLQYGKTSAIKKKEKFMRHIFTDTLLCVYKIVKINIFFRPEEAMFENW